MALPTIKYDATTGSDTAASGAGPTTAVTGVASAHTGGVASTTITLTNAPDLSGVATDGSAAIWLATGAGVRHISKITAVDDGADTVTVEDSFTISSGTPVDYAIGGERQSFNYDTSNNDWNDWKAGWGAQLNGTFTLANSFAPPAGDATDGTTRVFAKPGYVSRPILDLTTPNTFVPSANCTWKDIRFLYTGTATNAALFDNGTTRNCMVFFNCEFDAINRGYCFNNRGSGTALFVDCEFKNANQTVAIGVRTASFRTSMQFLRCSIHNCGGDGFFADPSDSTPAISLIDCTIYNNGGDGINLSTFTDASAGGFVMIKECTIDGNTGDGIAITGGANDSNITIDGNSISNNGGYGINASATIGNNGVFVDYNDIFNNTSGSLNNITGGDNDITSDPLYTSTTPGSEDYTPQSGSPLIDLVPGGPTA